MRASLKTLKTLLGVAILALLGVTGYAAWYVSTPVPLANVPVEVEIPRGASLRGVMDALESAGIRLRRLEFETLARALRKERAIKAGSYEIAEPVTPTELLEKLTRGDVTQADVRLIEGWTFGQFRAALDESPDLRHDTAGLEDTQILARLQAPEPHPEGLFFPDTYFFASGSTDTALLKRAYRVMHERLDAAWASRASGLPLANPYEALTLASIVEKETGRAADRPLVAAVFVNRLKIGMRLQTDPAVIYGIGERFDGSLKKSDLERDHAFNTYVRSGLPPTPIALPGQASIDAVLHPAAVPYLYFVARGDGSSEFSSNIADHNRAVAKYQRGGR